MDTLQLFLAHAIKLETEAARGYEEMTAAMQTLGNREARDFFRQMAHYARLHQADAMARGGFNDVPLLAEYEYQWPDGTSPERAEWAGIDGLTDELAAMQVALEAEFRAQAYYAAVAATASDPEVRALATEFAAEESEHVAALEARISARLTRAKT